MVLPIFFCIYEDIDGEPGAITRWPSARTASVQGMPPTIGYIELVFWLWTVGRLLQELGSIDVSSGMMSGFRGHLQDTWNRVDFLTYFTLLSTVALRLSNGCGVLAVAHAADAADAAAHATAHAAAHAAVLAELAARPECERQQLYARNLYAVSVILIWTRLVQLTRVFKPVGQMSIVLGRMMVEDVSIFFQLVMIISPGFGIAFAALEPSTFPAGPSSPFENMDSPFWTPFWGLLGDVDREKMLQVTNGVQPSRWVLQVLLWVYMFITTVVLVNLLIAQMSQTYERGMEQGKEDWCFRRAELIIEFKDTLRGSVPPPFNLLHLPFQLASSLAHRIRCTAATARGSATVHPDSGGAGAPHGSSSLARGFRLTPDATVQDTLLRGEYESLCRCVDAQNAERDSEISTVLDSLRARIEQVEANAQIRSDRLSAQLQGILSHSRQASVASHRESHEPQP
jgi:hypothetical protein